MSTLAASCLVVGPRRSDPDYDVLAVSPGLLPAVEDLSRIRRHNFEVRGHVRPSRPVLAYFPLYATGADVWLLATTSLAGGAWVTTGLVLTPRHLDAIDGRVLELAQPWPCATPPPFGSTLAMFPVPTNLVSPPPTEDARVRAWADRLGRMPLAIEAPGEAVRLVLAAVLDAAPAWRRRTLSFLTAPPEAAGGEPPALAVYETGAGDGPAPGYELVVLREARSETAEAPAPAPPPVRPPAPALAPAAAPGGVTVEALERLVAGGDWRALVELERSGVLDPLKRGPAAERLAAAIARALRAAPREGLEDRERLASALAAWRLGAAWTAQSEGLNSIST
jgi:hypothetical protein